MASRFAQHPASYRDPAGFVFTHNGALYRQVNQVFAHDWDSYIQSGLYNDLVAAGQLLPHRLVAANLTGLATHHQTIQPEALPFIAYPYEWTFGMLKDAALLTLDIAVKSLEKGFILKDASPYNVQLHNGRMVFIDSLSFETYGEGEPWVAYRQFCESFLAPLALMHYCKLPLNNLFLAFPDGVPLLYAKRLLPFKSRLNLQLYLHLHLHAGANVNSSASTSKVQLSKPKLLNVLESLRQTITGLRFEGFENVWGDYYSEAATRDGYLQEKKTVVAAYIEQLPDINTVVDVGGNSGEFALLAWKESRRVICADGEHHAVERLYQQVKAQKLAGVFPVVMDVVNPSPAIGVNNTERDAFLKRAASDLVLALAVVHHLAIGRNVPFSHIAETLASLGKWALVEWVPKNDGKAQELLRHKKDVYDEYKEETFLSEFSTHFAVKDKRLLEASNRTIYLMQRL